MSKRRNREGAPNLPQETLERARRQAAIDRGELPPEPAPEPIEEVAKPAVTTANPYRTVAASQRRVVTSARRPGGSRVAGARNRREAELDSETISELLDNPTIFVTEAELKAEYSFVVADLRNMFMLAAGLMVLLVVLATVLPR